jgi:hypothetical protein
MSGMASRRQRSIRDEMSIAEELTGNNERGNVVIISRFRRWAL